MPLKKYRPLTNDANNLISANYTAGLALLGLEDSKGAADAFRRVTAQEGKTEDEARKTLVFQAHSRLAELNGILGDHAAAVQEYQYIIENSEDVDLKGRSLLRNGIRARGTTPSQSGGVDELPERH